MSKELKIVYEPHPVTPARKAELRKQGFKILDARFDPDPKDAPVEKAREPVVTKTVAELLAMADDGTAFPTFRKAAKELLGDKMAGNAKKPEIVEALKLLAGPASNPEPVVIPEEWEAMTDDEMVALAKALGTKTADAVEAHAAIAAAVAERAARG